MLILGVYHKRKLHSKLGPALASPALQANHSFNWRSKHARLNPLHPARPRMRELASIPSANTERHPMKLFYCPFACSLADHIALEEAGIDFERERVDLKSKMTATGRNYNELTSKGYVPALELDNGEILTENVAILDWIASHYPKLGVRGELGRTRLLETLAYISTELHRSLRPLWHSASAQEMEDARSAIETRLGYLSESLAGDYLFGDDVTVADCYLFVMLLWAERFGLEAPGPLLAFRERMRARPAVKVALAVEGLS